MGGKFADLDEYFKPGLTLTVLKKEYVLPLPSAELGLWCRRVAETYGELTAASTEQDRQAALERAKTLADDLPELPGDLSFEQRMLGPAYEQMVADGVPEAYIGFCAVTAYRWIIAGEDDAYRYWTSGGRPELLAREENRAQRRAATQTPSTGAADNTPSPASTSGTKSRRKSGGNGRAARSGGRKS